MSTPKIIDMINIDFPLFVFTHCRDVVLAVSKAGAIGVFGALHYSPGQLKEELEWIEQHTDGRPYAIDLVTPYTEAWDDPATPDPLTMPLQTMATTSALSRISRNLHKDKGA